MKFTFTKYAFGFVLLTISIGAIQNNQSYWFTLLAFLGCCFVTWAWFD
jgi:hypothetical protein